MSYNLNEIIKIKRATSGSEITKNRISEEIKLLKPIIEETFELQLEEQKTIFRNLKNKYTQQRQLAFNNGATSYASPDWAVPALCESWLLELSSGSKENIHKVEILIEELSNPNRSEESNNNNKIIGFVFLFLASPLILYYHKWWSALIVFVIGLIISGWSKRHDGPFDAK